MGGDIGTFIRHDERSVAATVVKASQLTRWARLNERGGGRQRIQPRLPQHGEVNWGHKPKPREAGAGERSHAEAAEPGEAAAAGAGGGVRGEEQDRVARLAVELAASFTCKVWAHAGGGLRGDQFGVVRGDRARDDHHARARDLRGVVAGEAILGANLFKDLFAGIRDLVGGRSATYERELQRARR